MVWQSVIDKSFPEGRPPTDVAGRPKTNQSDEGDDVCRAAAGRETSPSVVLCSVFNKKETFKPLKTDGIADPNE